MDEKILTAKKVAELREIAKTFNIAGYQKLRKAELIKALTDTEYARTGAEKTETEPACDGDSVKSFDNRRSYFRPCFFL